MVFSSLVFLGLFLPIILLLYHSALYATKSLRVANKVVLMGSLFFYSWGEPLWILAMLLTATVDYVNGRRLGKASGSTAAKLILASSIVINLGILFVFKYLGFVTGIINSWTGLELPALSISMPIGISFYTFQSLSYIVDLYRKKAQVQKNYFNYVLYVSMFPQLVAGPIIRYVDVERQINCRSMTFAGFAAGIKRFCSGLGKKVILANTAGAAATALLDGNLSELSVFGAWLGILFFAFQIYFDFSGYSDMALGLGKMFGFDYKENFNYPYISTSITGFWRRWHMSLSGFFRDYVYIPLGGNRKFQARNILVVWFLTGLWHGASWNFIAWGMYYGILLMIEKYLRLDRFMSDDKLSGIMLLPFRWLFTMLIVLYGWGIFYFTDSSELIQFSRIFFFMDAGAELIDIRTASTFFQYFWMLPIFAAASTPLFKKVTSVIAAEGDRTLFEMLTTLAAMVLMAVCFFMLVGETYNPFLYFRF